MSAEVGFADGQRHPWIDAWCQGLSRIAWGQEASALLEAEPGPGALVLLPTWRWVRPVLDVGRKSRAHDGGTLLLPVRLTWPHTIAVVGDSACWQWSSVGMGYADSGRLHVTARGFSSLPLMVEFDPVPVNMTAPLMSVSDIRAALNDIVTSGEQARWDLVSHMEGYLDKAVSTAHSYLSKDVAGSDMAPPLLDELELASVRDSLLFGDASSDSQIAKIIDHSLAPQTFSHVDPQRYVSVAVRRAAQEAVRRAIGDPKTGSRIRKLARETGLDSPADLDELVARCRVAFPRESMTRARVERAMTVGSSVLSRSCSWDEIQGDRWAVPLAS